MSEANPTPDGPVTRRLIVVAAAVILVAALKLGEGLFLPLALAVLISFLLAPACYWLERRALPRVAAVVLMSLVALSLFGGLGFGVYSGAVGLIENLPSYRQNIVEKLRMVPGMGPGQGRFEKAAADMREITEQVTRPTTLPADVDDDAESSETMAPSERIARAPLSALGQAITGRRAPEEDEDPAAPFAVPVRVIEQEEGLLGNAVYYLGFTLGPVATIAIVAVLVIFILLQRDDLRDRIIALAGTGRLHLTTQALDDAAGRISRFLLAQAIVNGTYGVTIGLGLAGIGWFIGGAWFPNLLLWALLCALLRFIPYLGPWIAAVMPLTVAFAAFDGYGVFLAVSAWFITIELLSNNVMEPYLYGSSTGMSPLAVVLAATFWAWLWGPMGLLLAIPITVCLVVLGKHIPAFQAFDTLLGDTPVLEPSARLYQRLLARQPAEARKILADACEAEAEADEADDADETERLDALDDVLLPALSLADRDHNRGVLSPARTLELRRDVRDLLTELLPESQANTPEGARPRVMIVPTEDLGDEIAGQMLAGLLRGCNVTVENVRHELLVSEKLDRIRQRAPACVVVSAVTPVGLKHLRYLVLRLCQATDARLIVALWKGRQTPETVAHRIGLASSRSVVFHLPEATERTRQILQEQGIDVPSRQCTPAPVAGDVAGS